MMKPTVTAALALAMVLASAASAEPASGAKPQYGTSGFDIDGAALDLKPGDDFFRYANGKWLDATEIPDDKPGYSLRIIMRLPSRCLSSARTHRQASIPHHSRRPTPASATKRSVGRPTHLTDRSPAWFTSILEPLSYSCCLGS